MSHLLLGSGQTSVAAGPDIGDNIANSLMLDSGSSQYLSRTFGAPTSTTTCTISFWVKRGKLSTLQKIFAAGDTGAAGNTDYVAFNDTADTLVLTQANGSTAFIQSSGTQRDPAAWDHFVAVYDTANGVAADRQILYQNGVRMSLQTTTNSATTPAYMNRNTIAHYIGRRPFSNTEHGDYYLANIIFVDGQALTPSSFGRTSADTGQWVNKTYTGTYGNNGFKLDFANSADLGNDVSGNNNDWTTNGGISSANQYTDTPTNRYAVMDVLTPNSSTITVGNLKQVVGSYGDGCNFQVSSGKWVAECIWTATNGPNIGIFPAANYSASLDFTGANGGVAYNYSAGNKVVNGSSSAYGSSYATGDVIRIELDLTSATNTVTFFKNGTSQGAINLTSGLSWKFGAGTNGSTTTALLWNFGQCANSFNGTSTTYDSASGGYWRGSPTAGFKALCTANLPTPAVIKGALHFNAKTRTGNGGTATVSGELFQPDLVWTKGRSGATDHAIYDSVRGVQKQLESNTTTAETTETTGLTAFNSDGFTAGALAQMNTNTATYIDWMWKGGGAAVTNNSGSISSQVSANTTAGISIVTYTGTGANATVGHGLSTAPKMIIVRNRTPVAFPSGEAWAVQHVNLTSGAYKLSLNATSAQSSVPSIWNSTLAGATTFSIGTNTETNESGRGMLALCFAEVEGFSKAFSYSGNSSADGVFVYLGFKPRWIIIKRTDTTNEWVIHDTARATYNLTEAGVYASAATAEGLNGALDILSNGFKQRANYALENVGSYIGFAFAEAPFKYATAR